MLARQVLTIPASKARSKRLSTSAGVTTTKKRNLLGADNVEPLVTPNNYCTAVDSFKMSKAATPALIKITWV